MKEAKEKERLGHEKRKSTRFAKKKGRRNSFQREGIASTKKDNKTV